MSCINDVHSADKLVVKVTIPGDVLEDDSTESNPATNPLTSECVDGVRCGWPNPFGGVSTSLGMARLANHVVASID